MRHGLNRCKARCSRAQRAGRARGGAIVLPLAADSLEPYANIASEGDGVGPAERAALDPTLAAAATEDDPVEKWRQAQRNHISTALIFLAHHDSAVDYILLLRIAMEP